MLKQALAGVLEPAEVERLLSAFDVVGDIAIIKIPDELAGREELIAQTIISRMKNVKTVLKQNSPVQGEFRTRELEHIGGEVKYDTVYRENHCLFKVDVRTVYFSPRLSTERERVAAQVRDGERVLNMFAGVGTFSIVIAKQKACAVDSVDNNPAAFALALESLKLNRRLKGDVKPVLADAREYAELHRETFDRVIMPLPERAAEFLESAVRATKLGGQSIIHYYQHVHEEDYFKSDWIRNHLDALKLDRKVTVLRWKRVREVGPRLVQTVADLAVD